MGRYTIDKYASLEINRASFLKTGMIVSQTPLAAAFTTSAPCENGMWVNANKAAGEIAAVSNAGQMVGIVYTAEKEYGPDVGLKNFKKVGGDYPRVGIVAIGDTFTSNCFTYATSDFTNDAAVDLALVPATLASAPLYLIPSTDGSGAPKLVKAAGLTGAKTIAQVIKKTTMPNGEAALKYVFTAVNAVGGV